MVAVTREQYMGRLFKSTQAQFAAVPTSCSNSWPFATA
jgi:hypothetical protein